MEEHYCILKEQVRKTKVSVDKIFAAAKVDVKGTVGKLNILGRLLNPDGVDTFLLKFLTL